jgi:fused signal recognition particle receptor
MAASQSSWRQRLTKSRGVFSTISSLRSGVSQDDWESAQAALLRADVGVSMTTLILGDARERVKKNGGDLVAALSESLVEQLHATASDDERVLRISENPDAVSVWLMVGVNGVGKTTTIAKLAYSEKQSGRAVLLAAGDTFRAAAAEQLSTWGKRIGVDVITGGEGADPGSVVFDSVSAAKARGISLVIADTAGRLHTKTNLIAELAKIRRVGDRPPGEVCEVLLVLDATTGQNGLQQVAEFTKAVGVTGVVLTKLDGSARGGVVIAIEKELSVPIKLVGTGESMEDLMVFEPQGFIDALLAP